MWHLWSGCDEWNTNSMHLCERLYGAAMHHSLIYWYYEYTAQESEDSYLHWHSLVHLRVEWLEMVDVYVSTVSTENLGQEETGEGKLYQHVLKQSL